ncbi:Sugar phosphate permease (plasmid) [Legionella adelaidensis]|uniref:Lysosomal dipeptide transporter MFSD1 n=1 Tax=Legionella adelaidensis TaxID=45056 RepID=A0A0W0R485_9GAMM|nr:MFS transporter [Legionella adelaidensis]KTC65834.1 major facilitator family transporter transporter [Legionella adelaidensis]VEH85264.1 Sugar phosphate permease [Legionella adelaidensis]
MSKNKYNNITFDSPYFVWFLGALFFFLDYIVRVSPSVLTPELMKFFHANAFTIGGFSAFFYYAYIGMQIPVGILVDRFGPKWLLVMASLVCAFSTFLFAGMNNITAGFFSRFLMGFGASFAFVGTLKLISLWFKPERFAFLAGFTQALGMVGAMVGQGPLALVSQSIGWRSTMYGFVFLFIVIALLVFIFVKDKRSPLKSDNSHTIEKIKIGPSLKLVLSNGQNWLNCLFIGLLYAPSACFGEQWGASFLSLNQNISIAAAGHETGIMFIGLAIGCPILGFISDRLKRRLAVMRTSVVMCFILLTLVIYGRFFGFFISPAAYTAILFVYGFFNSGIVCSYALASEINPPHLTGMALGITNMASVIIGALMIPLVGFILDHFSTFVMVNEIPIFDIKGYQIAFAALPVGFIIAFLISFLQKETYCERKIIDNVEKKTAQVFEEALKPL